MIIRHVISLLLTRVDTRHPWLGRTGQDSCLDHTLGEVIFPKLYNSKKISSSNIYKFTTHYFIDTSIDMSLTCKVLPTWVNYTLIKRGSDKYIANKKQNNKGN